MNNILEILPIEAIIPIKALLESALNGVAYQQAAVGAGLSVDKSKVSTKADAFIPLAKQTNGGFYCPPIDRVIFNADATIVMFKDGTKSVVVKEAQDPYDRTTAVVYAIVKRLLATSVNEKTRTVNAAYINMVHGLVENGYDQQIEELRAIENEKDAQKQHEARQKALQEKAFKRQVKAAIKAFKVHEAALAEIDSLRKSKGTVRKPLNEATTAAKSSPKTSCNGASCKCSEYKDTLREYHRPSKPFSQFTVKEKREYWKAHSAKRRAKKIS